MKLKLCRALPNMQYLYYYNNFRDVVLHAYYDTKTKKMIFMEHHTSDPEFEKELEDWLVRDLFNRSIKTIEKPFLAKDNKQFYSCLFKDLLTSHFKRFKKLKRIALKATKKEIPVKYTRNKQKQKEPIHPRTKYKRTK